MLTEMDMVIGERYNWQYQPVRLKYVGRIGRWFQFEKIDKPGEVWCEVHLSELHMIERTKTPA